MNSPSNHRREGFNSFDLLILLIVLGIIATLGFYHVRGSRMRGGRISCVNNVKQIGLSVVIWSMDNGGRPPSLVSTNRGGAMETIESGATWRYFTVMSNELGTPKILICPEDKERRAATSFGTLRNTNLSFFFVPEADRSVTNMWLVGDRNLTTNDVPLQPGLFTMSVSYLFGWSAEQHQTYGNLCTADGMVSQPTPVKLQRSAIQALAAYRKAATNTSFRLAIP